MRLDTEFIRLPIRFDADRLAEEVLSIPEASWIPHPQGFPGNSALLLCSVNGDPSNDDVPGPYRITPTLERCEYLRQVIAAFGSVVGRTRLMRIDGNGEANAHNDLNYYWQRRLRVHVPIVTDPRVDFLCGEEKVHMAAGECWVFDTWKQHNVLNPADTRRIHLVVDTLGSPMLWDWVKRGFRPALAKDGDQAAAPGDLIEYRPGDIPELRTEDINLNAVMPLWELQDACTRIIAEMRESNACKDAAVQRIGAVLTQFSAQWRALWNRHGAAQSAWPGYQQLISQLQQATAQMRRDNTLRGGTPVPVAVREWIVKPGFVPNLARAEAPAVHSGDDAPEFDRPLIIVAGPRSGSTLLYETLTRAPELWSIGGESHAIIEGIEALHPKCRDYASNRLEAGDLSEEIAEQLRSRFAENLHDRFGRRWSAAMGPARLLEKTPKNALRIPFLNALFPDAHFVYLVRDPLPNVSSILEAWRSGRFVTYQKLPGWNGGRWSLLLVPGWRDLEGKSLAEVAAYQWRTAHEQMLADLGDLGNDRWSSVRYEDFVADPQGIIGGLAQSADLDWDLALPSGLPLSAYTLSPPDPDKWKSNAEVLEPLAESLEDMRSSIEKAVQAHGGWISPAIVGQPERLPYGTARADAELPPLVSSGDGMPAPAPAIGQVGAAPASGHKQAAQAQAGGGKGRDTRKALKSVHTKSMVQILEQTGSSLAVSTYQAGKLVLVRAAEGKVNTHFREMRKPMGIAADAGRMAIGTATEIQVFRNVPASAARIQPQGSHDACFLPRSIHFTGNIDIHEMAWVGEELWSVNTRFGCLCTSDPNHSFSPRWQPPFLSALAPEDRCHLNGLAVVEGGVKYVTALGQTDSKGGWRENKADGGILMDVTSNQMICEGLSMPHSPRWYRDQLWVLESGNGGLCTVDPATGEVTTVVELPGFTRGLDFLGPLAFVGLSQVRESAVFSGIPITERLTERICGVWAVNIESGEIVGFLRFEQAVQEVFAVTVLAGIRMPELVLPGEPLVASSFVLPSDALEKVPPEQRAG